MSYILLVEDDPQIARFVQRGLEHERYKVEWLNSGKDVLHYLTVYDFDIIILDVMLPDIEGTDIAQEIRRSGIEIPIIMVTAKDGLDDKLAGFAVGADDYLTKPFDFEELLARIRALEKRVSKPIAEPLEYKGLKIDLNSHVASFNGERLDLTMREFALLEYFLRNQEKALYRERIISNVWGLDSDITANAVDVYVGYLRRKLQRIAKSPEIMTIRGVGFKLTDVTSPSSELG